MNRMGKAFICLLLTAALLCSMGTAVLADSTITSAQEIADSQGLAQAAVNAIGSRETDYALSSSFSFAGAAQFSGKNVGMELCFERELSSYQGNFSESNCYSAQIGSRQLTSQEQFIGTMQGSFYKHPENRLWIHGADHVAPQLAEHPCLGLLEEIAAGEREALHKIDLKEGYSLSLDVEGKALQSLTEEYFPGLVGDLIPEECWASLSARVQIFFDPDTDCPDHITLDSPALAEALVRGFSQADALQTDHSAMSATLHYIDTFQCPDALVKAVEETIPQAKSFEGLLNVCFAQVWEELNQDFPPVEPPPQPEPEADNAETPVPPVESLSPEASPAPEAPAETEAPAESEAPAEAEAPVGSLPAGEAPAATGAAPSQAPSDEAETAESPEEPALPEESPRTPAGKTKSDIILTLDSAAVKLIYPEELPFGSFRQDELSTASLTLDPDYGSGSCSFRLCAMESFEEYLFAQLDWYDAASGSFDPPSDGRYTVNEIRSYKSAAGLPFTVLDFSTVKTSTAGIRTYTHNVYALLPLQDGICLCADAYHSYTDSVPVLWEDAFLFDLLDYVSTDLH